MTSLYHLSQEYRNLLAKDEYDEADMNALELIPGLIEDKIVNCAYVIKELEGKLAMTEAAIKVASDKKKRIEKNLDNLEQYVVNSMIDNKMDKIDKDPLFDVKVQVNRSSVDDYDHTIIPSEYWKKKETLSLDKIKIKDDIENLGLVIPGVQLVRKISLKIG